MRVNEYNENAANMAAVGMFGFEHYDTAATKTIKAPEGMYIAALQTFDDTTVIKNIKPSADAVINGVGTGFEVPEGMTIMLNAESLTVTGVGLIYFGGK